MLNRSIRRFRAQISFCWQSGYILSASHRSAQHLRVAKLSDLRSFVNGRNDDSDSDWQRVREMVWMDGDDVGLSGNLCFWHECNTFGSSISLPLWFKYRVYPVPAVPLSLISPPLEFAVRWMSTKESIMVSIWRFVQTFWCLNSHRKPTRTMLGSSRSVPNTVKSFFEDFNDVWKLTATETR